MPSVPYCSCIRGLTKRHPMVVSWISADRAYGACALGCTNGARLMLSTPPAIIRSASPAMIERAAQPTASRPDAHRRLNVIPETSAGSPASSADIRATLRLSSPAWLAQPSTTSSTVDQSTPGCRAVSSRMTWAARSSGRTPASAPPYRPIGVRTPETRYAVRASLMPGFRPSRGPAGRGRLCHSSGSCHSSEFPLWSISAGWSILRRPCR